MWRPVEPDSEPGPPDAEAAPACPLGGLAVIMQCQLTLATVHVGTCRSCQNELLDHGGIVPRYGLSRVR